LEELIIHKTALYWRAANGIFGLPILLTYPEADLTYYF